MIALSKLMRCGIVRHRIILSRRKTAISRSRLAAEACCFSRRSAFMLQCAAMRRQLLSLLLALAALLTALAPPAYPPTLAQDGTPVPPVFVSDAPRMIARPPLGDTFDTAAGWLPDGLWRFEASAGYDGAGWRVEGAQRGMTSTLEFGGL